MSKQEEWEKRVGNLLASHISNPGIVSYIIDDIRAEIEKARREVEYGQPISTFIQWKGTDVCMDWFCEEGHQNHTDGDFAYKITCDTCGKTYETGDSIILKPASENGESNRE